MGNFDRLRTTALAYPEAELVYVEAWGDHPTFRVRNKNFVFSDKEGCSLSVKLSVEEAAAVVATDRRAEPAGYGLGRHGWVALTLPQNLSAKAWAEIAEWIDTSYRLVAPKSLVKRLP